MLATILSPPLSASLVLSDVTFEETVGHADLVVTGRVGKTLDRAWYGNEKFRTMYTKHEFVVNRVLSGRAPETSSIVLLTLGGTYWDEQLKAQVGIGGGGALQVSEGEEIVACLSHLQGSEFRFSGFANGKLPIMNQKDGGLSVSIETGHRELLAKRLRASCPGKRCIVQLSLDELDPFVKSLVQHATGPGGPSR